MKKIVQLAAIDYTLVKLLRPLNEFLIEKDYDVHTIASLDDYNEDLVKMNLTSHTVDIDRKISPLKNIKSIINIVKILRNVKPKILHVHTPVASVLGRLAGKIAGVPTIIYTAHGFYFHENMSKIKFKFYYLIEKFMARFFTDYIFIQSSEDYQYALTHNFKKENKLVHISNGIDLDEKFNYSLMKNINLRGKLGFAKEDFIVTFVGRLVEEKGILDLIEASQLLNKKITVIFMGELPSKERDNSISKIITEYSEKENIKFLGSIDNINEYLYVSDVFCLPSYREGMPRSIIEAMAMKNAVVATNIRGSREEIIDQENGYLINIKAPQEIAEKINFLFKNPDILESMKENAYDRAHKLYNEKHVLEKQLRIFESVIDR